MKQDTWKIEFQKNGLRSGEIVIVKDKDITIKGIVKFSKYSYSFIDHTLNDNSSKGTLLTKKTSEIDITSSILNRIISNR